jgi:hypothetical protein
MQPCALKTGENGCIFWPFLSSLLKTDGQRERDMCALVYLSYIHMSSEEVSKGLKQR